MTVTSQASKTNSEICCAHCTFGEGLLFGVSKFIVRLCRLCKVYLGRKRPGCSPVRLFRMAVAPRPAHTQMQAVSSIWFSFTVCKVSQHVFATATLRIATAALAWTPPETRRLESLTVTVRVLPVRLGLYLQPIGRPFC